MVEVSFRILQYILENDDCEIHLCNVNIASTSLYNNTFWPVSELFLMAPYEGEMDLYIYISCLWRQSLG